MLNTGALASKTIFITGASRGFGKALAVKVARDGANVVVASKTSDPHPKLEGTIHETAREVIAAGGKCLPLALDVRDEAAVKAAIEKTVQTFGGIDIIVNNASSMYPTGIEDLDTKRFHLMNDVILRGTFMVTKYSLPHLKKSQNPHILNICPPLILEPSWFKYLGSLAVFKYAVSLHTLGLSEDLKESGVAANGLWPKTAFWSAFVSRAGGYSDALRKFSRKPEIMTDAAYAMLCKPSREYTGKFVYDDDVLMSEGITDFEQYAEEPGNPLIVDIFVRKEDCKTFTPVADIEESLKGMSEVLKPKSKM
jgi:citronellol/citronellal dehydrogenase